MAVCGGMKGKMGVIQVEQILAQANNLKQRPLRAGRSEQKSRLDGYGGSDGLEGR